MNDRYADIKQKLLDLADTDEGIRAIIAIGSSTRSEVKADEYSDLDLIIADDNPQRWLRGDMPEHLGEEKISFVEPTLGGTEERRVIYENALDVDMIVFTPEQLLQVIREGIAGWVCNRGYSVLYDTIDAGQLLGEYVSSEITHGGLSEAEYINTVNDFFFHTIWASKKILRGELWSAKMCIDAYLKNHLLKMIEMQAICTRSADVWHDGRFLDRWADSTVKESLPKCFAHYDREDMISALFETKTLFAKLAESVAAAKGYEYPKTAADYADSVITEYFGKQR